MKREPGITKDQKERQRRIKLIKESFLVEPEPATMEMYLGLPKEKFDRLFQRARKGAKKRAQELMASQLQRIAQEPLYGMVELMCSCYYAYMAAWKDVCGERSFKAIYAARQALHSRNQDWGVSRLNTFLARVSSFKELLLLICAQPDEMPARVEELQNWFEHQRLVNIPLATWSKEEALEPDTGYTENLAYFPLDTP